MLRKKVLLVDDVEPFLEMEKRLFNDEEFEVCVAHDGYEGLKKATEVRPDLMFLDIFMPRMSGIDCCRAMKTDPALRSIPVVMVTASGYQSDYESCREAGCDHIMPKPINRREVQGMARKILGLTERSPQRAKIRLLVRVDSERESALTDYTINLSTGGLFLETESLLSVGTQITAEFVLPAESSRIRCSARIAWINSPYHKSNPDLTVGMGVQFLDLGLKEMDALRNFVRSHSMVPTW